MSVEAMTWAFQVPLKPCPKSVLVALANRADEDGYCWPGLDDLEVRTGWKRRAIQQALRELRASGLVCVSPRFSTNGVQTSNLYQIAMTTISCGEGAPHARGRVHHMHGEGAPHAPKSSSESSVEQSEEHSPHPPTGGVGGVVYSQEFEEFWDAFPSKTGKKDAWRSWVRAKDRPALQEILQAIAQAKRSERWQRGIIPNPATWLNQGRWADEVTVVKPVVVGPKAYQSAPANLEAGEPCPPEVAAKLARILGGNAFSCQADQPGAA